MPADAADQADGGDEAARFALARARDAARRKGLSPGSPAPRRRRQTGPAPEVVHGAGRDPKPLGDTVDGLTSQLGWRQPLQVGGVVGRWREVVGDQVADHCQPETFIDGELVVRTDSTAWATQLKLLLPQLQRRLEQEAGADAVTSIRILGPGGPSWRKGPRSVPGRGPRDTYG
ncbi:MAG: DUF721 domain-containing protein [Beutenbergiaceae bacterium]